MVEAVGPTGYFSDERLPMQSIEHCVLERVGEHIAGLLKLELTYPFAVAVSMIGVKGCKIFRGHEAEIGFAHPIRDEILLVPEVVVESPDDPIDPVLRGPFDWIWNAGGQLRSPHFDDSGRWIGGAS